MAVESAMTCAMRFVRGAPWTVRVANASAETKVFRFVDVENMLSACLLMSLGKKNLFLNVKRKGQRFASSKECYCQK